MKCIVYIGVLGFLLIGCLQEDHRVKTYELNEGWFFKKASDTSFYPATVPGTVHTDLMANDLIGDPYWRNNELELQWIEEEDWVYRSDFTLDEVNEGKHYELQFDGLDTYADIYLNDTLLGKANNMFREWTFDVKSYLKSGKNKLELRFNSPINNNREKFENLGYELPAGSETCAVKVSPFTRKAAYHFGWDWGPRFVTSGIWRPARLVVTSRAKIDHVEIIPSKLNTDEWQVQVSVAHSIYHDDMDLLVNSELIKSIRGDKTTHNFTIKEPQLWWPNGSGEARLYETTIALSHKGKIIDQRKIKYGLRTVELINEPDTIGTSYYFKVNGEPLFMKGANYIPQDLFLPRVTEEKYLNLLTAAKDAGMNMLRVWGGGIYENDIFYELCDSLGILVWQDFMFAGSMYPGDEAFTENVKEEVNQNIKRLRNHPCLALWCGNNEIEVAWHNWGWQEKFGYSEVDSSKIWNDYLNLFHKVIPQLVEEESNLPYVTTSPLSNWGTPENFNHSSMHYWGVWHGKDDLDAFEENVGRFMVEYGFQSYPNLETLQKYTLEEDWSLDSEVMRNRQKSYIGNGEIERMVRKYFHEPRDFEEFVRLSQVCQALALEKAMSAHLNSEGHCMGSLFWQLNDCWPGPSWSVIDYRGEVKLSYVLIQVHFRDED